MRSAKKFLWAILLLPVLLANTHTTIASDDVDDYTPDVTARVARISVLRGEAQIRHINSQDWERVTQNLPLVEGDEIATDENSRLEIQFNKDTYLRLSENAYLQVTTLRDEGIALSLPNGTLSLRVLNFDKDRTFFEIDAPKSTVAVQKAGMYRIDAGDRDETKVRVTVTEDGLARIYSDNSGFTLRSGRSSELQIAGNYAGEWDTTDASRYTDDFDSWALQRDAVIAKRLQNAYYDQYYDSDIYGAEDLNGYGDWIYTKKYGYVWKPYGNAISSYDDWSPYRYGQWRWIPPYGWTWVNDEPWGWATYHHGRWVYDNGWYWSPYAQYRARRSWWSPALVVVTYIGSSICWYPLPYNYGYYNYNYSTYVDRRRYNTTIINNTTVVNPTPTPVVHDAHTQALLTKIALAKMPKSAVVSVAESEFGRGKNFQKTPPELATKVLSKTPSEIQTPPVLPTRRDLNGKVGKEIRAESPKVGRLDSQVKTGAIDRKIGDSMDNKLRTERIYGDRAPVRNPKTEIKNDVGSTPQIRDTGAVKRVPRPIYKQEDNNSETKVSSPREMSPPIRSTGGKSDDTKDAQPVFRPRKQRDDQIKISPPSYEPPPRSEKREVKPLPPSSEPSPKRQEPRPQPPQSESKPPPRKAEPTPIEKNPVPPTEGKGKRNDKDN
ncbi:hypothetical protein BH20ACI1_BH20ACI1_30900 [soil metagenome]